uniref:Uncharacterized protein n=1 Tax=Prolemur simus TaxID=1328070 RepID=A0A8C9ATN5_PROSS
MWDVCWLRPPHVGHDPARSAEDLRLEMAEEPLREDPHPGPSPSSCCASHSFLVWVEAITWNPAWEGTSAMGPQHPPALNRKSLDHGDTLHVFPRDRLDPKTLDLGPPLE